MSTKAFLADVGLNTDDGSPDQRIAELKPQIEEVDNATAVVTNHITELLVRKADSLLSLQELEEKTETIYAKAQSLKGEKEGKKKKNKKQKRKARRASINESLKQGPSVTEYEAIVAMFTEVAEEFPTITLSRLLMAEEQFSKFDTDGDESLGVAELEKMLEEAGHILNQQILISVISVIDTSGDKRVDFSEYLAILEVLDNPDLLKHKGKALPPDQQAILKIIAKQTGKELKANQSKDQNSKACSIQ